MASGLFDLSFCGSLEWENGRFTDLNSFVPAGSDFPLIECFCPKLPPFAGKKIQPCFGSRTSDIFSARISSVI
jgi:hypothetical protein